MTAQFIVPATAPYNPGPGGYTPIGLQLKNDPPEGLRCITGSISWLNDLGQASISGKPPFGFLFDASIGVTQPISRIGGLWVDNRNMAQRIIFFFPDTQYKLEVNAFTAGWYPIPTNGLRFFILLSPYSAQNIGGGGILNSQLLNSTDATYFHVYNTSVRPSFFSTDLNDNAQGIVPITIQPTGTTTISLTNGAALFTSLQVWAATLSGTSGPANINFEISDTLTGLVYWSTQITAPAIASPVTTTVIIPFIQLVHFTKIKWRCTNAIKLTASIVAGTLNSGVFGANYMTSQYDGTYGA